MNPFPMARMNGGIWLGHLSAQQCPITEFTKHIAIMVQVGLEVALPVSTIIALMKEGGCSLELLSGEKLYKKLLLLVKPCLSVAKNGDLVIQLITEQGKAPQLVVPHDRLATLPERISEMLSALSAEDAVTALASLWLSSDAPDGVVPDAPCAELLTKLLQTSVKNRNAQVLLRKTDGAYGFRTLGSMQ